MSLKTNFTKYCKTPISQNTAKHQFHKILLSPDLATFSKKVPLKMGLAATGGPRRRPCLPRGGLPPAGGAPVVLHAHSLAGRGSQARQYKNNAAHNKLDCSLASSLKGWRGRRIALPCALSPRGARPGPVRATGLSAARRLVVLWGTDYSGSKSL